jgi:hypothetical protein
LAANSLRSPLILAILVLIRAVISERCGQFPARPGQGIFAIRAENFSALAENSSAEAGNERQHPD